MRTPLLLATILSLTCSAAVWGAPLPQNTPDKSLGVATCASSLCHGAVEPWKDSHVLQTEYFTWSRMDKHARAYSVLTNTRSQEIARKLGARVFAEDAQGMFLWADLGTDTNALATRLFDAGYLAAPGSLFCPSQLPSTWMRFNVASSQNPAMWRALQKALA